MRFEIYTHFGRLVGFLNEIVGGDGDLDAVAEIKVDLSVAAFLVDALADNLKDLRARVKVGNIYYLVSSDQMVPCSNLPVSQRD